MKRPILMFLTVVLAAIIVALAAAPQKSAERKHLNAPARGDDLPFSDAVLVADTLYLSGWIGIDPETGRAPADITKEITLLMDGMKRKLELAGMTMDDLVTVQVFCTDLALYDQFNAIYRTYFKEDFPARAFIGAGSLLRDGHFEIQGTAVRK